MLREEFEGALLAFINKVVIKSITKSMRINNRTNDHNPIVLRK